MLYLFLDTETTGIEERDQIWNLAYVLENEDGSRSIERDLLIEHSSAPSHWVLENTKYYERLSIDAYRHQMFAVTMFLANDCAKLLEPGDTLRSNDVYMIGAVPAFDDRMIRKNPYFLVSPEQIPYNYHVIDVEAVIMGKLGLAVPPKMKEMEALTGIANTNAHEALADARHARDLFRWAMRKDTGALLSPATIPTL